MNDRPYIIKPSLRAFPKTWAWIIFQFVLAGVFLDSDRDADFFFFILFMVMPPLLLILLYRYGRSYTFTNDVVTFYNRFGGKRESFLIKDIVEINIKPIAFGAANTEFVLRNRSKKIMANVVPKAEFKVIRKRLLPYFGN